VTVWKWIEGEWIQMGHTTCPKAAARLAEAIREPHEVQITRTGARPCAPH
jgi:hypothetical protein